MPKAGTAWVSPCAFDVAGRGRAGLGRTAAGSMAGLAVLTIIALGLSQTSHGRSLLSLDTKIVVTPADLGHRPHDTIHRRHRGRVLDGLGESVTGWRGKLDECPSFTWRGKLWSDHAPAVTRGEMSPPEFRSDLVYEDEFKRLVRLGAAKRKSYAQQVEQCTATLTPVFAFGGRNSPLRPTPHTPIRAACCALLGVHAGGFFLGC